MLFVILSLLPLSVAGCLIFNKKVHEVLPVAVFVSALGTYLLALFSSLTVAFTVMCALSVAVSLVILVYSFKMRHGFETEGRFLSLSIFETIEPSLCLILVCIAFCLLMSWRKVYFYDDLSYWAIYTKNIFAIDHLPTLFENCSVDYKDYTPIIQILQYLVMFGRREFSEASMFQTNVCLIYVLLLPLLSVAFAGFDGEEVIRRDGVVGSKCSDTKNVVIKATAVVMYVIFPHILTAQFYYRLGVDLLLALTFGYILYYVYLYDLDKLRLGDGSLVSKDEVFRIVCIASGLAFLTLIKASGALLAVMAIIMFALHEGASNREKSRTKAMMLCAWTAILCLFTIGEFLSWQWFLRRSWNNGYLSNRVKEGITGGTFAFPEYTWEVVINYIRHFCFVPLTGNRIGATALVLVLFIIVVSFLHRVETKEPSLSLMLDVNHTLLRQRNRPLVSIMVGLVVFAVAHIGMYLFVFDEWEAHGLMEFDRYITQYLGGAFMLYVCVLIKIACADRGSAIRPFDFDKETVENPEPFPGSSKHRSRIPALFLYISTAIFLVLLPYGDMKTYLIPANYRADYEQNHETVANNAKEEWDQTGIAGMNLPHDGSARLTVIADSWDEKTQHLIYAAVPQPVDCVINTPAIAEGELTSYVEDHLEAYVYVAQNAKDAYKGDWDESAQLTEDHKPLQPGVLYRVIKENDTKTLVVAK